MHNLTETVKRNLNFESDRVVERGGVFVKHRTDEFIEFDANHFQFNSIRIQVHFFSYIDLDHRNVILDTISLCFYFYAPSRNTFSISTYNLSAHKFHATLPPPTPTGFHRR